jgi:Histone-like transcription factor (CBF/NF-Y) and archaeal histone
MQCDTILQNQATELFIAHMAQRTWGVSKQLGRKNIRTADMVEAVYADGALYFLRDEFAAERKRYY